MAGSSAVTPTVTVTGAAVGDKCFASQSTLTTQKGILGCAISNVNEATVTLFVPVDQASPNLASGTLEVMVLKK
jgi:hypothetical protein